MLHASLRNTAVRQLIGAVFALAVASVTAAATPAEVQEVSKLVRAGQLEQAMQRADSFLAGKPRDAQMRFLKGLILTEQGKTPEAITVFVRLSEEFPELPEPYNNLAVLYASQGQFDKARASLEMAIRTHPSYATAHENLGDVYAKLASQAYDKALQLDSANTAAETKLSLIRDLIGSNGARKPPAAVAAKAAPAGKAAELPTLSEPAKVAAAPALPAVVARPAAPAPAAKAASVPALAAAPAPAPPVKAPPVAAAPPTAPKSEPAKAEAARSNADAEVVAAVEGWARAWASQNFTEYVNAYTRDFDTPKQQTRAQWEKERKERIVGRAKISVTLQDVKVGVEGNTATVKFRQHYKSGTFSTNSPKTLVLIKTNGKWLIKQERTA